MMHPKLSLRSRICQSRILGHIVLPLVLISLSACVNVQLRIGTEIQPQNIETVLQLNRSTQSDVRRVFGEPDGVGAYVSPITGEYSTMWSYYFAQGTLQEMDDTFLFVYFDGDVYEGYLWFSNTVTDGGQATRLSDEQADAAAKRVTAEQRAQRAQANQAAGQAFLADNAGRPGVVVLPSGLQYQVLAEGAGAQAAASSVVRVHYHGTRIDGSVFDSSVERGEPAQFALTAVVPGYREAISNMRTGDHWRVFVPGNLAYGERGAGKLIGPNETLIYEVQLLEVLR